LISSVLKDACNQNSGFGFGPPCTVPPGKRMEHSTQTMAFEITDLMA